MQTQATQHVVIIGAGITGLLIAQGLKKRGISFNIYDSDPSLSTLRAGDWGIGIHWSIPFLEECLTPAMLARIEEAQTIPHHKQAETEAMLIYNGETGELMNEMPLKPKFYRLSRRRMRIFAAEGIEVQFNKRLVDVEAHDNSTSVTATFEDGTRVQGTCLIGADGAKSAVRKALFHGQGHQLEGSPYTVIRVFATFDDVEMVPRLQRELHEINSITLHPMGMFLLLTPITSDEPSSNPWNAQILISYASDNAHEVVDKPLEIVRSRLAQCKEPWKSVAAQLRPDLPVWAGQLRFWKPRQWNNRSGRITLAGDASHPMTFHRGQGLNHAINDAGEFVKAMQKVHDGKAGLDEVIKGYEAEMIQRGAAEVDLSVKNTQMLHRWEEIKESPVFRQGIRRVD